MDTPLNDPFSFSDFTSASEADVFEKIEPLPDAGSTALAYVVRIKGQDFFMKRLRPELQQAEIYRNLFRKEFELGKRLSSPYIVGYDRLVDNEAETYLLRENVVGCTLKEKLMSSPEWFLEKKNMRRFMLQMLAALQHLHENHVVHADLKPENVMLTRINNDVKLIDLGFAFADSHTSTAGCTPEYAAPEQKNGGEIDMRTDIYAFGLLIYYIYKEVGCKPPRLFSKIADKCTQPAPESRFQSVEEIVEALLRRRRLAQKWMMALGIVALLSGTLYILSKTYWGGELLSEVEMALNPPEYDFEEFPLYYKYNSPDSSTVKVVGARRTNSVWIKPSVTYKGRKLRVTGIANNAFFLYKHLEACHIAEGIDSIGERSFYYSGVMLLNLPKNIKYIGRDAMSRMDNLHTLKMADGMTSVTRNMATHCSKLKILQLPNTLRVLPYDMLAFCIGLEHVAIPDSVRKIERGVFWHCEKLKEVTLPKTVEKIDEYAFYHCYALKKVVLPRLTPPEMCNSFNTGTDLVIYVPKEAVETYRSDINWQQLHIESIESLEK